MSKSSQLISGAARIVTQAVSREFLTTKFTASAQMNESGQPKTPDICAISYDFQNLFIYVIPYALQSKCSAFVILLAKRRMYFFDKFSMNFKTSSFNI